jgi:hypothetical protein
MKLMAGENLLNELYPFKQIDTWLEGNKKTCLSIIKILVLCLLLVLSWEDVRPW